MKKNITNTVASLTMAAVMLTAGSVTAMAAEVDNAPEETPDTEENTDTEEIIASEENTFSSKEEAESWKESKEEEYKGENISWSEEESYVSTGEPEKTVKDDFESKEEAEADIEKDKLVDPASETVETSYSEPEDYTKTEEKECPGKIEADSREKLEEEKEKVEQELAEKAETKDLKWGEFKETSEYAKEGQETTTEVKEDENGSKFESKEAAEAAMEADKQADPSKEGVHEVSFSEEAQKYTEEKEVSGSGSVSAKTKEDLETEKEVINEKYGDENVTWDENYKETKTRTEKPVKEETVESERFDTKEAAAEQMKKDAEASTELVVVDCGDVKEIQTEKKEITETKTGSFTSDAEKLYADEEAARTAAGEKRQELAGEGKRVSENTTIKKITEKEEVVTDVTVDTYNKIDEAKTAYTVGKDSYIVVKQSKYFFIWTPEDMTSFEDVFRTRVNALDASTGKMDFYGMHTGYNNNIKFDGTYWVTQNEDGSLIFHVSDKQKISHLDYGTYTKTIEEKDKVKGYQYQLDYEYDDKSEKTVYYYNKTTKTYGYDVNYSLGYTYMAEKPVEYWKYTKTVTDYPEIKRYEQDYTYNEETEKTLYKYSKERVEKTLEYKVSYVVTKKTSPDDPQKKTHEVPPQDPKKQDTPPETPQRTSDGGDDGTIVTHIPDEPVALTDVPDLAVLGAYEEISDGEIPLAVLPMTGDMSNTSRSMDRAVILALVGATMTALGMGLGRKEE